MKLVASLLVHNEIDRYLGPCISSLLEFCDEVRVLDDGSTDGFPERMRGHWGEDGERVHCQSKTASTFFEHEGRTRQELYEWTLAGEPTHIIAIDADEFIGNGALLREQIENQPNEDSWLFPVDEVWSAWEDCLCIRTDGAWGNRKASIVYRVDEASASWSIADRALACGREPQEVQWLHWQHAATELLHFGWARRSERVARHARYAEHDGGRFHVKTHLDSIIWPDDWVRLDACGWPEGLLGPLGQTTYKEELLMRTREGTT